MPAYGWSQPGDILKKKKKAVHKRPKTGSHEDIPLPFTYFVFTLSKVAPINVAAAASSEKVASRAYLAL